MFIELYKGAYLYSLICELGITFTHFIFQILIFGDVWVERGEVYVLLFLGEVCEDFSDMRLALVCVLSIV